MAKYSRIRWRAASTSCRGSCERDGARLEVPDSRSEPMMRMATTGRGAAADPITRHATIRCAVRVKAAARDSESVRARRPGRIRSWCATVHVIV